MRNYSITAHNMEENNFNPMNVNGYSVDELIKFVYPEPDVQPVTVETITSAGLFGQKRIEFENRIGEIERQKAIEEAFWQETCSTNTVDAYKKYQRRFPNGQYFNKAAAKIMMLEDEADELRRELFQAMRERPWEFNKDVVRALLRGVEDREAYEELDDVASRFVCKGFTITADDLKEEGLIPNTWNREDLTRPAYQMPQLTVDDFGNYPSGRTDVFFMGVPRSGKSSVLAGIITKLRLLGAAEYVSYFRNQQDSMDPCLGYYNALIRSIDAKVFPESTGTDTINFLQMDLSLAKKRITPVTFVELSGEAFSALADKHCSSQEVWKELGAQKILANDNKKMLFFVLDYSIISEASDAVMSSLDQELVLENALRVFSTDGTGKIKENKGHTNDGCTMSKVDTVAVIVTKSDRMNTQDIAERTQIAEEYIYKSFSGFMDNLYKKCKALGINKKTGFRPYILTFSLGEFHIGETIEYNGDDSKRIAEFIYWGAEPKSSGGIFKDLF